MFTLPGMSDIYQGGKALYLSAVTQTNNGQHINSFAQNSSLMTTIIVSYNLKCCLSKSETLCLVLSCTHTLTNFQELHQGQQPETEGVGLEGRAGGQQLGQGGQGRGRGRSWR